MKLLRSSLRRLRILAPLALLVALLSGCTGTATRAPIEETFIATSIAVIVPTPAHPGDPISVIVKPTPAYQPGSPRYNYSFTAGLYGPFPSLSNEQTAIMTSTVGPPTWQNRMPDLVGGGEVDGNGVNLNVEQTSSTLPATLAPGLYDVAVTLTLNGSRATARSDTIVRVVAAS